MTSTKPQPLPRLSVAITGIGSYVPEKILTNADLEKTVDTTDEWITSRTGIKERRIAASDQFTSDMAAAAARVAIQSAGVVPRDIDLIICGTATPDTIFPATACYVQQKIGADRAAAFDVTAACSGFLYGAIIAEQFILSGLYKTVLVIGAEKLSSIVNWRDRNTCVLFGDGAGAAILQRRGDGGILARDMGTDGGQTDILSLPAGGCRMPATAKVVEEKLNCLQMAGKEVYKYAVQAMEQSAETCLKRAGLKAQDVRWFIPHQANMRIMEAVAGRLEIPMERCIVNVHKYGNTSAACIPIALHEAVREGKIKRGDTILMVAFGGGLTWASMALEW